MSLYSTGELAKLCQISVRTVQFYDKKGLVQPSTYTEGGRRLYDEKGLEKMKLVCILREMDLSIKSIKAILEDENPKVLLTFLIDERRKELTSHIKQEEQQLEQLKQLEKTVRTSKDFSIEEVTDVAMIMKHKTELRQLRVNLILLALPLTIAEWASFVFALRTGLWIQFAIVMVVAILLSIVLAKYYMDKVAYICPNCHQQFVPSFKENFFASHTPNTRKLTCPNCDYKGYCVEIYRGKRE